MTTFNPEQQAAICAAERQICLLATAGSGKTRTLVGRTQRLLADGVDPQQMVVITFTNNAAAELSARSEMEFYYCGTLHGFMLRLLQQFGESIGMYLPITVIDEETAKRLMKQAEDDCGYKGTKKAVAQAMARGPFALKESGACDKPATVALAYYQKLSRGQMLDFDSILHYGLKLIRAMTGPIMFLPKMGLEELAVTHLFVDEYQDTSPIDAEIYAALPVEHRFVVGDPDQAIFAFRGATVENILSIARGPQWHAMELNDNYRCDAAICEAAQRLVNHNSNRIKRETRSATGEGGSIHLNSFADELSEVKYIAQAIQGGENYNETAVLVRTNKLVEFFSERLEGYGVPVKRRVFDKLPADWGDAMQYLSLLSNPDNDTLAFWWLERTQGKRAANAAKSKALKEFCSINKAVLGRVAIEPKDASMQLARGEFSPESVARVVAAFQVLPDGASMAELSSALWQEYTRYEDKPGATVSTMHSAKGLEFDTVFLPAFEQGVCPSLSKNTDIEEERRLAFVAFTRARHALHISHSATRTDPWGYDVKAAAPSQFIGEAVIGCN